jgi:hypothetical protein
MAFNNWWHCPFCSATIYYHGPSGETQGRVVRLHFKYCRVIAPLVSRAALVHKQHYERKKHERNRKGRR